MARPPRLERGTICLEGRCSIQLSYGRCRSSTLRRGLLRRKPDSGGRLGQESGVRSRWSVKLRLDSPGLGWIRHGTEKNRDSQGFESPSDFSRGPMGDRLMVDSMTKSWFPETARSGFQRGGADCAKMCYFVLSLPFFWNAKLRRQTVESAETEEVAEEWRRKSGCTEERESTIPGGCAIADRSERRAGPLKRCIVTSLGKQMDGPERQGGERSEAGRLARPRPNSSCFMLLLATRLT